MFHRLPNFIKTKIERGKTKAQNILAVGNRAARSTGAKITNDFARDQGLHDRVSAFGMCKTRLRTTQGVLLWGNHLKPISTAAMFD